MVIWEKKRLGDGILKVGHGKSQHGIETQSGRYPILATGGEIGRTDSYLYDKPSVLIGRKGTIDRPQYMDTPFWTIDTLFYTMVSEGYYEKYIYYLFCMIDWDRLNEASGVPSLSSKVIVNIEVSVPDKTEQRRIAKVLSNTDALITALEKLIAKKRAIKQGAMQELLTGKRRLPGFAGEWVEKSLGEMLKLQGGYAFNSFDFREFGIPVIRISDITNHGVNINNGAYIEFDVPQQFQVTREDVLIAMSGATTGKIGRYDQKKKAYINQRVGKFDICDVNVCDLSFVYFCLMTEAFVEQLEKSLAQGAQPNISGKQIEAMRFLFPPTKTEQTAIVSILSNMDAEIDALTAKLNKLRNIKQGMMSELLTGRIRLIEGCEKNAEN